MPKQKKEWYLVCHTCNLPVIGPFHKGKGYRSFSYRQCPICSTFEAYYHEPVESCWADVSKEDLKKAYKRETKLALQNMGSEAAREIRNYQRFVKRVTGKLTLLPGETK